MNDNPERTENQIRKLHRVIEYLNEQAQKHKKKTVLCPCGHLNSIDECVTSTRLPVRASNTCDIRGCRSWDVERINFYSTQFGICPCHLEGGSE
jgi:hypothetical protein